MNVSRNEKAFDAWFARNYDKLKTKLMPCNLFGELFNSVTEDVFHDAYLTAREAVLSNDESEYQTIFFAAYKRQSKKYYRTEAKEIRPQDLFWALLRSESEENVIEEDARKEKFERLANKMMKYARVTFSADEFMCFEMYFNHSFSLPEIGLMYGVTGVGVGKRINHMKHVLCMRFDDELTNLL